MTAARTALVIGGGIAGPVAAMALRKAGIEATVYEAYQKTADGIGGSLAIAPNGIAALEVIGAEHAVLDNARPVPKMALSVNGRMLAAMPGLAGLPPLQLVRRGDLYRALRKHAIDSGVEIVHGRRLVGAENTGSGVLARFADGSTASADVLVGADGVHSTVRRLIDPDAPGPDYTGLISIECLTEHDVPGADPDAMYFAFGKRAYYLYWALAGGGTNWGANLPRPKPLTLTEARAIPAREWLRELRDTYGEDTPGGDLARHATAESLQVNGAIYLMPSIPHWHGDRMVLVGDAVHAPSNSSGQGASLAIESAVQLARCLRDLPDVPTAFAAYERLRRPRVERVAARAARINHAKAPGALTRMMMPVLMKIMARTVMNPEKTLGPEQRYRIDWAAPVEREPAAIR